MAGHITVMSKNDAWIEADHLLSHDVDYDVYRSKQAGYPIYYSTWEDINEWVSDLGDRLEVNLADGTTVNIWVKEREILQELINKSREYGYTA